MRWILPFSYRKKWYKPIFLNPMYASGGDIVTELLIRVYLKNRALMLFALAYTF